MFAENGVVILIWGMWVLAVEDGGSGSLAGEGLGFEGYRGAWKKVKVAFLTPQKHLFLFLGEG